MNVGSMPSIDMTMPIVAPNFTIPAAYKTLGGILAKGYKNFTNPTDATFDGNFGDIFQILHFLGHGQLLINWLPEGFQIMAKGAPQTPSLYQLSVDGREMNWDGMIRDLVDPLAKMGVKFSELDLLDCLDLLCKACQDEAEFVIATTAIKPLAMPQQFKDWANVIKPFQRRLFKRLLDERGNGGDRQGNSSENLTAIKDKVAMECKRYNAESDLVGKDLILQDACAKFRVSKQAFLAKAAELAGNVTKPKAEVFYDLQDFLALESGGGQFLFPGLIPMTGLGILAGESGAGKTTLALDMAAGLIFGEEFCGVAPTKKGKVLLVSSDEEHPDTQRKIINRGLANAPKGSLVPVRRWDVSQMAILEESIETLRPDYVIIDSLRKIHLDPNFDENSSNAVHTLTQLEQLAAKYCCFIWLIHHTNKSKENKGVNKLRGSTAIAASCSCVHLLEGDQNSKVKKLSTPKFRSAEPINLSLEMDGYHGTFNVVGDGLISPEIKSNGDRLTEYFQTRPDTWLSGAELKDIFPDMGRSIYKALTSLVQRGTLREKPAKIGRGKVWCINQTSLVNVSNPLPPMPDSDVVDLTNETIDIQEFDASQRLVNAKSTLSQRSENVDTLLTNETIDIQEFDASQRLVNPEGEGVFVDLVDLTPVPQTTTEEIPPVNVYTPITEETTTTAIADNEPKTQCVSDLSEERQQFKPGDLVVEVTRPNVLLALKVIDDDGEYCRCLDVRFGGDELCLLADLIQAPAHLLEEVANG